MKYADSRQAGGVRDLREGQGSVPQQRSSLSDQTLPKSIEDGDVPLFKAHLHR